MINHVLISNNPSLNPSSNCLQLHLVWSLWTNNHRACARKVFHTSFMHELILILLHEHAHNSIGIWSSHMSISPYTSIKQTPRSNVLSIHYSTIIGKFNAINLLSRNNISHKNVSSHYYQLREILMISTLTLNHTDHIPNRVRAHSSLFNH